MQTPQQHPRPAATARGTRGQAVIGLATAREAGGERRRGQGVETLFALTPNLYSAEGRSRLDANRAQLDAWGKLHTTRRQRFGVGFQEVAGGTGERPSRPLPLPTHPATARYRLHCLGRARKSSDYVYRSEGALLVARQPVSSEAANARATGDTSLLCNSLRASQIMGKMRRRHKPNPTP